MRAISLQGKNITKKLKYKSKPTLLTSAARIYLSEVAPILDPLHYSARNHFCQPDEPLLWVSL